MCRFLCANNIFCFGRKLFIGELGVFHREICRRNIQVRGENSRFSREKVPKHPRNTRETLNPRTKIAMKRAMPRAKTAAPVLRDKLGRIISGTNNPKGNYRGSRDAIRHLFRVDGGLELYEIMLELARGTAYAPKMPDGREGPIIVPTPDVRFRAAMELAHTLNGRPVSQAEMANAEVDSKEVSAIRALDDTTLRQKALGVLQAATATLNATEGQRGALKAILPNINNLADNGVTDAELIGDLGAETEDSDEAGPETEESD